MFVCLQVWCEKHRGPIFKAGAVVAKLYIEGSGTREEGGRRRTLQDTQSHHIRCSTRRKKKEPCSCSWGGWVAVVKKYSGLRLPYCSACGVQSSRRDQALRAHSPASFQRPPCVRSMNERGTALLGTAADAKALKTISASITISVACRSCCSSLLPPSACNQPAAAAALGENI